MRHFELVAAVAGSIVWALPALANDKPSLDGFTLGSGIRDAIHRFGVPKTIRPDVYEWRNAAGGTIEVTTDANRDIDLIDVHAGPHERRTVQVLSTTAIFRYYTHVNFDLAPHDRGSTDENDLCGPTLIGSPCVVYSVRDEAVLVANFGGYTGMADGTLSELLLGKRQTLVRRGLVKPC